MHYALPIIFLILSILCFVLLGVVMKQASLPYDNQADCENQAKWKAGECGIWMSNFCRKGTLDGPYCKSTSNYLPLILLLLGISLLITSIVLFFKLRKSSGGYTTPFRRTI